MSAAVFSAGTGPTKAATGGDSATELPATPAGGGIGGTSAGRLGGSRCPSFRQSTRASARLTIARYSLDGTTAASCEGRRVRDRPRRELTGQGRQFGHEVKEIRPKSDGCRRMPAGRG